MIDNSSACLVSDFEETLVKETLVALGPTDSKIIVMAKERNAGMMVMTTHGGTGLSRALMGSVAEKVVRLASCPILSVRPTGFQKKQLPCSMKAGNLGG